MRKTLFTFALLNSIAAMASNMPDLEDIKAGLASSELTVDINSHAARFYRGSAFDGENEEALLRAVQHGHGYAARVLFKEFGKGKPAYRELLLNTVLRKLESGFTAGLEDDMSALGHGILYAAGWDITNISSSKPNTLRHSYIATGKWKELGKFVAGINNEEDVTRLIQEARIFLEKSAEEGSLDAKCALASIAMQDNDLHRAFTILFDIKLYKDLKKKATRGMHVYSSWCQSVREYIDLVGPEDSEQQLAAYRALGEVYLAARQHENAYRAFFEAYKRAHQLRCAAEQTFSLLTNCNECIFAQKRDMGDTMNMGRLRYLGYELHSFIAQQAENSGDEKLFHESQSLALGHLKDAIYEGYTEPLAEILEQSDALFPSLHMAAQFLEDIVTHEHKKEMSSRVRFGGSREYKAFQNHTHYIRDKLESKLLAFFTQAQEHEIELKFSLAKSLLMLQGDLDCLFEPGTDRTARLPNKDDALALFFKNHKNVMQVIRTMDLDKVPAEDKAWIERKIYQLNIIYKNGIRYLTNEYFTNRRGFVNYSHIINSEEGYILNPENKEN